VALKALVLLLHASLPRPRLSGREKNLRHISRRTKKKTVNEIHRRVHMQHTHTHIKYCVRFSNKIILYHGDRRHRTTINRQIALYRPLCSARVNRPASRLLINILITKKYQFLRLSEHLLYLYILFWSIDGRLSSRYLQPSIH